MERSINKLPLQALAALGLRAEVLPRVQGPVPYQAAQMGRRGASRQIPKLPWMRPSQDQQGGKISLQGACCGLGTRGQACVHCHVGYCHAAQLGVLLDKLLRGAARGAPPALARSHWLLRGRFPGGEAEGQSGAGSPVG